MNSRQRVIAAIDMNGPDRVPIMHVTLPGAFVAHPAELEELYRRYPQDIVNVGSATCGEYGPEIGRPSADPWGSLWLRHTDEHKGQVVHCPLADWKEIDEYVPPDTAGDELIDQMTGRLKLAAGGKYTLADGDTLWQRMYYLHGFQAMQEDLLLERNRCERLRDLILEVIMRRLHRLAALPELDGVHFRDDWGTQQSLLVSPPLWREMFKPAYAAMFDVVRGSGKHVWFHSDGVIDEIIPDLIEIGVQVINPQCNCMPRERLAGLIAGRVCLLGDLDRQWALPFGAPDDVRQAVRDDVDAFSTSAGGLILRGELAGDVPLENATAMLDEMVRYGTEAHAG